MNTSPSLNDYECQEVPRFLTQWIRNLVTDEEVPEGAIMTILVHAPGPIDTKDPKVHLAVYQLFLSDMFEGDDVLFRERPDPEIGTRQSDRTGAHTSR